MVIFSMDGTECEGRVRLGDKGRAVPTQAKEEERPEAEELLDRMSWQCTNMELLLHFYCLCSCCVAARPCLG
jgi:hypothetical protein